MANKLDQALDEVIRDRQGGGKRSYSRRDDRHDNRRQVDDRGVIRKRLGPTQSISSFVRTIDVKGSGNRGGRNVNSTWSHDKFDDYDDNHRSSGRPSITSRLGFQRSAGSTYNKGQEISISNLHYNVTEKDVEELFSTIAQVLKARLQFDPSGRSTGVATVKYELKEDAERAIKKYHNIELDGQKMQIELKEYTPRVRNTASNRGFNTRDSRIGSRHTRDARRPRDTGRRNETREKKSDLTVEDLDKEMDSYMSNNTTTVANEDTDMMMD